MDNSSFSDTSANPPATPVSIPVSTPTTTSQTTPTILSDLPLESLSEKRAGFPVAEDIPEAVREAPGPETPGLLTRLSKRNGFLLVLAGVGAIALISLPLTFLLTRNQASTATDTAATATNSGDRTSNRAGNNNSANNNSANNNSANNNSANNNSETIDRNNQTATADSDVILGHLKYPEAPQDQLQAITPDGSIKLRKAAAEKFLAMSEAAQAAGITLVPISGFRSIQDQNHLFFDLKAERGQVARERATVSAPPGHSEHHTGYAIDIGDGDRRDLDLNPAFDQTRTYQWLKQNAAYYSFELSFPKGNPQGVSYEPWHWRFVGDRDSLETFYRAHNLRESQK